MESISAAHRFLSPTAGVPLSQNRFSCSVGIELLLHEHCIHSGAINGDDWPFYIRSFSQHRLCHCNIPLGILWNNSNIILEEVNSSSVLVVSAQSQRDRGHWLQGSLCLLGPCKSECIDRNELFVKYWLTVLRLLDYTILN